MSARAGSAGKKAHGQVVDQVAGQGHEQAGAESGLKGAVAAVAATKPGRADSAPVSSTRFHQDEESGDQGQNAPGNVPEELRGRTSA